MLTYVALTVILLTCLQNNGLVRAEEATTCAQGTDCASCSGNKVANFAGTQVCCPGCVSQYFNYDTDSNGSYCNCNVLRVSGNSFVGEVCSGAGMTTYCHLNNMPVCCPDTLVVYNLGTDSNGHHIMNCVPALTGNCWRGSQCNNCNKEYVGNINGEAVCCANCQESGLILALGSVGNSCNCNN